MAYVNEPATNGDDAQGVAPEISSRDMKRLRDLLFGRQQAQIDELAARLDDPSRRAEELSHVLPEALARSSSRNDALTVAITSSVEKALDASVQRNTGKLADTIFPVMGPAIRKAISETFRARMQSFNSALTKAISWQGMQWRVEAKRSGKSYAEIVMLHSLLYRVEQVFLIHNDTGLVLQHVVATDVQSQDSDMVASMLSAIRDFTRDSFSLDEGESLNTLEMGDLTVWIEQGPKATLAAVIRGNAPFGIREVFQAAIEGIERDQADLLANFDGDVDPFAASRRHLEPCLLHAEQGSARKKVPTYAFGAIGVAAAAAVALMVWSMYVNRKWERLFDEMSEHPGLMVANVDKVWGTYHLTGLRDPLSIDPDTLVQKAGLDPSKLVAKWEAYQALTPSLQLERARRALQPPDSVQLSVADEGVLRAMGSAPREWIADARQVVRALPGIDRYDDSGLADQDEDLTRYIDELAKVNGIFITRADKIGNDYVISGLRDPLSEDPEAILASLTDVDPTRFQTRWETYQALGSEFVLERAIKMLEPPETVTLTFEDTRLVATGESAHQWLVSAQRRAPSIMGVESIDLSAVVDLDLQMLRARAEKIESYKIFFIIGTTTLAEGQEGLIEEIAAEVDQLRIEANRAEIPYVVQLMGHADKTGDDEKNLELSQRRAVRTRAMLAGAGIEDPRVYVLGAGTNAPLRSEITDEDRAFNRAVTLHVTLEDAE